MSAPETGPAADPMFGPDARHGWHRPTYSHITVDYPRWWDDDPQDSPTQEAEHIRRCLAARNESDVRRQNRELDAYIAEHTQQGEGA